MNLYKNRCKVTNFFRTFALDLQLFKKKDVRLNFQKAIASSQATLPITCGVAFLLWFVPSSVQQSASFSSVEYGLWQFVPSFLQEGYWSLGISAFCAAMAVYLLAELNNAHVLLRVSSRMLSSMLAILLCVVVMGHQFQPGSVVMLLSLLSLFPLFSSYQSPHPLLSFLVYLPLSVASLTFPKLLWVIPFYWLIQGIFRALSLRCFISSILATLLPYWIYGGIAILTSSTPLFLAHIQTITQFHWFDYTALNLLDILLYAFIVVLFLTGTIDFIIHQFMDKTRTRIIYNTAIIYGLTIATWIALQPQYFSTLLPLFILSTAILFGHFFTLTHTKFSHIYCIILMVLTVLLLVAQYLPQELFTQFLSLNSHL